MILSSPLDGVGTPERRENALSSESDAAVWDRKRCFWIASLAFAITELARPDRISLFETCYLSRKASMVAEMQPTKGCFMLPLCNWLNRLTRCLRSASQRTKPADIGKYKMDSIPSHLYRFLSAKNSTRARGA